MNLTYIFYAITIGIIPALLWLWLWLREDSEHPEPKSMIAISFIAGMIAAPITAIVQMLIAVYIPESSFAFLGTSISSYIILWVIVEELFKFSASFFALKSKYDDEPIDAMIYLITSALGFVAVENTLYALKFISEHGIDSLFASGFSRFIGPSLLHIVTSGIVGLSISLSFYIHGKTKQFYIYFGLITAVVLHTLFNFFILADTELTSLFAFISVWFFAIVLLVSFGIVKKIRAKIL